MKRSRSMTKSPWATAAFVFAIASVRSVFAATVLLDGFSGDLSAYTHTRILDTDGGSHNTASWQISGGALVLNTSTAVSGAEQYAFIRDGLSLAVDDEIQADFSVSGSQDLGLYVGGTTPATDVREDYIAVYARGNGQLYSRGLDGTAEYALAGGGAPAYDKLFIKRVAANTYEAGYYDGTNRTVIVTRTPSTPNDGDVVGFYADVRATGILGSADNLTLQNATVIDDDGDGLPDDWEQQITDDNPGDAIVDIYDVLPGDDYDDDGYTNQQEYELGLDPTVQNDSSLDSDGDYLPDLWEFGNFTNLTYTSYDDPDFDGYNNQAERIGGTDPLLTSEHPSWVSPSVAYMRDSVVTNNACLMGGGNYGHAINGVSFQDSILYTFDGYQYTAYYDTVGSVQKVCLARRTVNETAVGDWEIIQTDSEFINGDENAWDAHNVIAFGICPQDGTLHVAWDHHDNALRYRRSVAGLCTTKKDAWGQPGMLNAEQNWLTAPGVDSTQLGDVTYPQFITTPSGGLVMDRRYVTSGNGDQYLNVYNPATTNWLPQVEFIDRAGTYVGTDAYGNTVTAYERCAYLNGFDFDSNGTIHVTWTWRESASQYGNRDICYAYSPDLGTNWYNNAGTKIADTSIGQKITMNSPGITVVPLNMRQLLINQQAQCVDNDGRVHALMLHRRQESGYGPALFSAKFSNKFTAYYHYFRDPDIGKWTQRRIPPPDGDYEVGSRPCMGYDAQGNVYAAFLYWPVGKFDIPGARLNNTFTGTLVIASASKASQYTDWEVLQVIDDHDFDGEPLLDQPRLLSDNILAVYIQEHDTYVSGNGIPTPLHVYEFAVDVPEPAYISSIAMTFLGGDTVISAFGQTGTNYQMQASMDLSDTNGWSSVGPTVGGMNSLIAFPDPDGLQNSQSFYRVFSTPSP